MVDIEVSWRSSVDTRLGEISQGIKDLGRNFDSFKRVFDGNGQPGRCKVAQMAREELEKRIRALEDARERLRWVDALWGMGRAAMIGAMGALVLALLRHYVRWV